MTHRTTGSSSDKVSDETSSKRLRAVLTGLLVATLAIGVLQPTAAQAIEWPSWEFEGTKAEDVTAKGVDVVLIRPLAAIRVLVGAAFFIPAALFASPGGREGIDGAYEVLLEQPIDYAFRRELGEI